MNSSLSLEYVQCLLRHVTSEYDQKVNVIKETCSQQKQLIRLNQIIMCSQIDEIMQSNWNTIDAHERMMIAKINEMKNEEFHNIQMIEMRFKKENTTKDDVYLSELGSISPTVILPDYDSSDASDSQLTNQDNGMIKDTNIRNPMKSNTSEYDNKDFTENVSNELNSTQTNVVYPRIPDIKSETSDCSYTDDSDDICL